MKKLLLITAMALVSNLSFGQVMTSNRNPVGLEHNLLFNAKARYNVICDRPTDAGMIETIFDGALGCGYFTNPPTASSPIVITIANLPNIHTQTGAWVGWSTRYLPAKDFIIEGYNTYGTVGWVTFCNVTNYSSASYSVEIIGGVYSSIRIKITKAQDYSGDLAGWVGMSEFYFIHPEATRPYEGLNAGKIHNSQQYITNYETLPGGNVHFGMANKAGKLRWGIGTGEVDDNNGNGSNFKLFAYKDDGDYNYTAMGINRKTGDVWFNGNVSLNTNLWVEGKIATKEVIVQNAKPWADYVFKADYKLRSLAEVESFVTENSHLPEVPSAAEIDAKGINVGEMNNILLKKIEELTLYMIQQQKEIEALKTQINK